MSIGYGIGIRTGATGIQSEEKTEQQPERDDELMLDFIQFHNIIICPHSEALLLELLHIHNSSDDEDEDHPIKIQSNQNIAPTTPSLSLSLSQAEAEAGAATSTQHHNN